MDKEVDAGRIGSEHERLIADVLLGSPVARHMGLVIGSLSADRVELKLPFSQHNVTVGNIVHGGILATLVDIAAVALSVAGARELPSRSATSNMSIAYLAPADNMALVAEATALRRGRRQVVAEVMIRDHGGTPIAKGLVTVRLE